MSRLFETFPETSAKEWKQKIQVDLRGADYNETLITKTAEGINIKPFYHADDRITVNSVNTTSNSWKIAQTIYVQDENKANEKALEVIEKGANSIIMVLPSNKISLKVLINGIDLEHINVHFKPLVFSKDLVTNFKDLDNINNCYLHCDIIGNLARTGNWFQNLKLDHEILEEFVTKLEPFNSVLSVDLSLYQNAGGTIVQQLAYGLAHANEYLNHFQELPQTEIVFNVAMGNNYFMEIAKLRALRLLWKVISEEYNLTSICHIVATPSKRNKTLYDYNTNMLRTTTECMSAILGSADTIVNLPYDAIYHKDNEFGERIARNQLLVLKHESYFDKVSNAAEGAYYIESLTNDLSQKTLDLFKEIETSGGFLKLLKEGTIQRKLKESANKEQNRFNEENKVLVGTNKYINETDRMNNDLQLYPFVKINKRKTLIEPIIEKRLAEKLEQERLKTE